MHCGSGERTPAKAGGSLRCDPSRDVMLRIASVEGPSMEQLKQQMWDVPYRFPNLEMTSKRFSKGGPSQSS